MNTMHARTAARSGYAGPRSAAGGRRGVEIALGAMLFLVGCDGCSESPQGRTYYERTIEPILLQKCAGNTSGCHATNTDDPFAVAAGNLDVTTFENVQKRRDVLTQFGAYPLPLLLIKAAGAGKLKMFYDGQQRLIDVPHVGLGILDPGSEAFFTLQTWLENGATENGLRPAAPPPKGTGDCSKAIPPGFDPAPVRANPQFAAFTSKIQPIFKAHGCSDGSCHGAPQSDFYITCGDSDDERAFNFSQTRAFVTSPVDDSQLLRVPLAAGGGGHGHTGGDQFPSTTDPEYLELRAWAEAVGPVVFGGTAGKDFFAKNVQPLLLTRGCQFEACHSPQAFNDFKLRTGSPGFFSAVALQKNYELLRDEFMALEFQDARRGRAVAKTVMPDDPRIASVGGIAHRGGALFETAGPAPAEPAACPATYNPATATAFCTMQEWLTIERTGAVGEVTLMTSGAPIQLVYVQRTTGSTAGRLEFDTFQGTADLMLASTTFGADQSINPVAGGTATSLLNGCGLGTSPDVQHPDVAHDGVRVTFAARADANQPLGVYVVDLTNPDTTCVRITPAAPDSNGLKVHNFDPVWAPDGTAIVFASTRGKTGATKSRKRFLPQSDLWRIPMNGLAANGTPEQMTFLSNSEVSPAFMREGRVTMTTEKVSDGFYQLSGRRINWDLTDYHPLLAQRKDSPYADLTDLTQTRPSIGYSSATDIREASNGDFLLVLSDVQANGQPVLPGGGGALAIFNRSIGPFEMQRTTEGYLPSLTILGDPGASGRAGATASYRRPMSLPDGSILASYAPQATAGNFEIVAVNPRTNTQAVLVTGAAGSRVDATLAYKHPPRKLYLNRRQLVFGGAADLADANHAIIHMPDAPMVFTLLTANLRRGRPVDAFRSARYLAVYTEGMCPAGSCSANTNGIYEARMLLDRARLAPDGSVKVRLPSQAGVVLELQNDAGAMLVRMTEEHQLGPSERISMGVKQELFDAICGGCHGSISGRELDVSVTPDALTSASASSSSTAAPTNIGP